MRLITRNDTSLTVALIAAAFILFHRPLRYVVDLAQDLDNRYHLDLLPALLLLVVVFTFHQYRKRMQARGDALVAMADAALARTRSHTLAQLMTFSRALANALDRSTLQQVLWTHLPTFARDRTFWVLLRKGNGWEVFLQDATASVRSVDLLERLATRTLSGDAWAVEGGSSEADDAQDACFPMLAAGTVVGVLGVSNTRPFTEEEHHVVGAAAAVIAIGVKNMHLFLETRELSLRDGLTGCFNRGHGLAVLDAELRRARRTSGPLSILMFDVDRFKTVNDRFGHLKGDDVLSAVGAHLGRTMRTVDVRCRYGGDEFLVILPETPASGALQVAEELRQGIANIRIAAGDQPIPIAISIGVATAAPGELDVKALVHRADQALYRAKSAGRNRLALAIPPSVAASRSGQPPVESGDVSPRTIRRSASVG